MGWQIVQVSQVDFAARQGANDWRDGVALKGKCIVPGLGVLRGGQSKRTPHFWSIGHDVLLSEKRIQKHKRAQEDNPGSHVGNSAIFVAPIIPKSRCDTVNVNCRSGTNRYRLTCPQVDTLTRPGGSPNGWR